MLARDAARRGGGRGPAPRRRRAARSRRASAGACTCSTTASSTCALRRDLDLLCVDAADASDWPLPAGRLREFPAARRRADLVLLTRADRATPERLRGARRALRPERRCACSSAGWASSTPPAAARVPAPARPFLVSGDRAAGALRGRRARRCGQRWRAHARFRDHHRFTAGEIGARCGRARAAGADALRHDRQGRGALARRCASEPAACRVLRAGGSRSRTSRACASACWPWRGAAA